MKFLGAAAIVGVLVGAGIASGAGSASRIVDRTFVCNVAGVGFPETYRSIRVSATPRHPRWSPLVSTFTLTGKDDMSVGFATGPTPRSPTGFLSFTQTQCSPSSRQVPLSSTGLRGGRVQFVTNYKCDAPAQVLVHVRAVFTKPVTLGTDPRIPGSLIAKGHIATGQIAVRTLSGKPIAYATANDATGSVTIYAAAGPRCFQA